MRALPARTGETVNGFLRNRVLSVALGMTALLIGLFLVLSAIANATYTQLETRETDSNVRRVTQALAALTQTLQSTAADWGPWDDSYRFLRGQDPTFVSDNISPQVLSALHIDFMGYVTPGSRLVGAWSVDPTGAKLLPFPAGLRTLLTSNPNFLQLSSIGASSSGVLALPEGPTLFAARAVTDSAARLKPPGYIIVGIHLDEAQAKALSGQTGLDVSLLSSDPTPSLPSAVRRELSSPATASGAVIERASDTTVTGFGVLRDPNGNPGVVVRVTAPRTVHRAGLTSVRYSGIALAIFTIFSLGIVLYSVGRQALEIQERRKAEGEALRSNTRYRGLIENMAEAVLVLDSEGRIVFANSQASMLTGYSADDLLAMDFTQIMPRKAAVQIGALITNDVLQGVFRSSELEILHASGETIPVDVTLSPVEADSGIAGTQLIVRDIAERKRYEAELQSLADRDHLTGLSNRRSFERELSTEIERSLRTNRTGALVWMDLDGFKEVNDAFGHKTGDDVLVGVARVLGDSLRAGSTAARLGGDEFGILLPDTDTAEAEIVTERLLSQVHETVFEFGDTRVQLTASAGVAIFPIHGRSSDELLVHSDVAMYHAKNDSRNRFAMYNAQRHSSFELPSRFDVVSAIEDALQRDAFVIYAQPIINIADGTVDRYETLIRMREEDGSIRLPNTFLPTAERSGQIREIDRWMVRHVIALLAECPGDASVRFDVNLYGKAMNDRELLPMIGSELQQAGIDPSRFGIEITETAAIEDVIKAREFIEAVKDIGCRVALDDFGSGFSSFYYLSNLPVDALKIDGSFVRNLRLNRRNHHIVRAIAQLCDGFGISSTAEWVEDAQTLDELREMGVTFAQGFACGPPVPIEEVCANNPAVL